MPQLVSTVGGAQGAQGSGGAVSVLGSGYQAKISTSGAQAIGIVAQSISGGGGVESYALYNPSSTLQLVDELSHYGVTPAEVGLRDALQQALTIAKSWVAQNLTFLLSVGASGNSSGDGGTVRVTWNVPITTAGTGAIGILAQSISGGGGLVTDGDGTVSATDTLSGQLGAKSLSQNGNAMAVTVVLGEAPIVVSGANIATSGDGAVGILAQSIGGGGGYIGLMDVTNGGYESMLTSNKISGNGGDVTVRTSVGNNITTTGANAAGIFAQSLGGGGGALGINNAVLIPTTIGTSRGGEAARGGAISIVLGGNLAVTGAGSDGIFVQSGVQGTGGLTAPGSSTATISLGIGTKNSINAYGAHLYAGPQSGYAIQIDGGSSDIVTIAANSEIFAASGNAIWSSWGKLTINDYGTLVGNILLADGYMPTAANRLEVGGDASFAPGPIVNLGLDGGLNNSGTIQTGLVSGAVPTALTGSLSTSNGLYNFGLDLAARKAASLNVSGSAALSTAKFTGTVLALAPEFDPRNLPKLTVLTASSLSGIETVVPQPTAVFSFRVSSPSANSLALQVTGAHFLSAKLEAAPGMTANTLSVAGALQAAWDAGDPGAYAPVLVYLGNEPTTQAYQAELHKSDDEVAAEPGATVAYSNLKFEDTMSSCPVFADEGAERREVSCSFMRPEYTSASFSGQAGQPGFNGSSYTLALGGQTEFLPGWFIGGAVTPGQSWATNSTSASSVDTNAVRFGAVLKHLVTDRLMLAGEVGYGNDSVTATRSVQDAFYGHLTMAAQQEFNSLTARLSARYDIPFRLWYLQPGLDFDLNYARMAPYTESGGNYLDTSYQSTNKLTPVISPEVEIGRMLTLGRLTARLYTGLGISWLVNPGWSQTGHFVGLQRETITTSANVPNLLGRISAGVKFFAGRRLSFAAEYDGVYSPAHNSNGATLRLSWAF